MVGLGGVFIEVLRDAAPRLCPFGESEATATIRGLRGLEVDPLAVLGEGQGAPALDAALEIVVR